MTMSTNRLTDEAQIHALIEHHEMQLAVGDTVAFCDCLARMGGTMTNGVEHEF